MIKRSFRQELLVLAYGVVTASMIGISPVLQAQPTFKVGDRVEADPMLLDRWRPATVVKVYIVGGALNGYEIQFEAEEGINRKPEQYTVGNTVARGIRPLNERENTPPLQAARDQGRINPPPGAATMAAVAPAQAQPAAGRACSSDALLTAGAKAGDPMELSFKRAILGRYQKKLAETSVSTPLAVGVSFASFQIGKPSVNLRTTDGSYLSSAPVGANIYPVKTNFTACESFRSEITRTAVDGRYSCFKDNFGEWACGNASGWRTLDTQREILGAR